MPLGIVFQIDGVQQLVEVAVVIVQISPVIQTSPCAGRCTTCCWRIGLSRFSSVPEPKISIA